MAHLSQDGKKKIKGRSPIFEVRSEGRFWLFWWQCLVVKWYLVLLMKLCYQISIISRSLPYTPWQVIYFDTHPSADKRSSNDTISFYNNFPPFLVQKHLISSTSASASLTGESQPQTWLDCHPTKKSQHWTGLPKDDPPGSKKKISNIQPAWRASALRKFLFGWVMVTRCQLKQLETATGEGPGVGKV